MPRPPALTQADRELIERSRFLSETFKYSGFYVAPSNPAAAAAAAAVHPASALDALQQPQQYYTPVFERYSDRYKKILGKKNFYHEIVRRTDTAAPSSAPARI